MSDNGQYLTESYLRREIETAHIFPSMSAILFDLAFNPFVRERARQFNKDWFKNGNVYVQYQPDYHGKRVSWYDHAIKYSVDGRSYRDGGSVDRGPLEGVADGPVTTGEYTSIHNHTDNEITHEIDKSVTLENSRTSTLSESVTLDLTEKESAGAYGVSVDLEQHLGITSGTEESTSSSTTNSTAFNDTVPISPQSDVAIVYSKTRKQYHQELDIDAISDIAFTLTFYHLIVETGKNTHFLLDNSNDGLWNNVWHGNRWTTFNSVGDFCGCVRGYDPRAPHLAGYTKHMSKAANEALNRLEDGDALRLQLKGSQTVVADDDADYSISNIAGLLDSDLRSLFGRADAPLPSKQDVEADRQKDRMLSDRAGVRVAAMDKGGNLAVHWVDEQRLHQSEKGVAVPGGVISLAG